jgi:hypothetical protein
MDLDAAWKKANAILAEPYERAMKNPQEPQIPREEAAEIRAKVEAIADDCDDARGFWEMLTFTMNFVDPYPALDRRKKAKGAK